MKHDANIEVTTRKLEKLSALNKYFKEKKDFHYKKSFSVRGSSEKRDYHFDRYKFFNSMCNRTVDLAYLIKSKHTPQSIRDEVYADSIYIEYKMRLKRKAEGKEAYQTKHLLGTNKKYIKEK